MKDTIEGHCRPVMAYRSVPLSFAFVSYRAAGNRPFSPPEARACQKQPGGCVLPGSPMAFSQLIYRKWGCRSWSLPITIRSWQKAGPGIGRYSLAGQGKSPAPLPYLGRSLDLLKEDLGGPLVLGDGSDNPGAGGLCDTTHILRRILERGITGAAIGVIRDPANVEKCRQAGEGAAVTLWIGGQSDPRLSGGPLKVTGMVEGLCDGRYHNRDAMERGLLVDMGPTAVLQTAGTGLSSLPTGISFWMRKASAAAESNRKSKKFWQ